MEPRAVNDRRAELQIIDVREDEEWEAGRIEAAVHIAMDDIPARLEQIDHDRTVVTVCRSGHRSEQVADYLTQVGFAAFNLDGGMQRWADEGLPVSTLDGDPGRVA